MVSRKTFLATGLALGTAVIIAASRSTTSPDDPMVDFLHEGFARRDLTTPSGRMAIYEAGEGEPIVFLHGIGGGASSWTWIFIAPEFARSHRVIVPDWVGWGASEHPRRFILFDDYVSSLEAFLDGIGAPVTIVAQSLACGFAMALAERRPDLVRQFVLHTPSGGKDLGENAFGPLARATITPFASRAAIGFGFYRLLFHRRAFIRGWLEQQGFADKANVTDRIVDAFLYNARRPDAAWSALPFASDTLRYDIAPYLKRLQTPAAILWGAEETQVGLEIGHRLAAIRPDLPFDLIPASKACPELEQPAAVIDIIRKHLAV